MSLKETQPLLIWDACRSPLIESLKGEKVNFVEQNVVTIPTVMIACVGYPCTQVIKVTSKAISLVGGDHVEIANTGLR